MKLLDNIARSRRNHPSALPVGFQTPMLRIISNDEAEERLRKQRPFDWAIECPELLD